MCTLYESGLGGARIVSRLTHRCEQCPRVTELFYCRRVDEYLCEECADLVEREGAEEAEALGEAA